LQARFIRECVEKEVMTELCGVMDDKSEKMLWKILDRQRETFKNNNVSDYFDVDNEFHLVSPSRKLGTLVPRGIGGFVELNSLDFFTIEVLSVNLSLLIMI